MSACTTTPDVLKYQYHTKMYLRDGATGNPRGMMVSYKDPETGRIHFGWSACHPHDTFKMALASKIAANRAVTFVLPEESEPHADIVVPDAYVEYFELFLERMEKYYRTMFNVNIINGYAGEKFGSSLSK